MPDPEIAEAENAEATGLPPVERLQVVEIRPEDTIIASAPSHTSRDQAQALRDDLAAKWPSNDIVVMSGGVELAVQRSTPAPAPKETR